MIIQATTWELRHIFNDVFLGKYWTSLQRLDERISRFPESHTVCFCIRKFLNTKVYFCF